MCLHGNVYILFAATSGRFQTMTLNYRTIVPNRLKTYYFFADFCFLFDNIVWFKQHDKWNNIVRFLVHIHCIGGSTRGRVALKYSIRPTNTSRVNRSTISSAGHTHCALFPNSKISSKRVPFYRHELDNVRHNECLFPIFYYFKNTHYKPTTSYPVAKTVFRLK